MTDESVFHSAYIGVAAAAGAITALALSDWRRLTFGERLLTLLVGFSFAVFVTPLVASRFGIDDPQALAGLTYIFGSGSNILLPRAIRWAGGRIGLGGGNGNGKADGPGKDKPDG